MMHITFILGGIFKRHLCVLKFKVSSNIASEFKIFDPSKMSLNFGIFRQKDREQR